LNSSVEYPLLATPLFLLPRLAAVDLQSYEIAFAAEMFVASALAIGLLAFHLDGRGALSRRLGWFALVVASLCPLAACRFDLAVMAWTFAAALAWSSGRHFLGGILAGSGVLVKFFRSAICPLFEARSRVTGALSWVTKMAVFAGLPPAWTRHFCSVRCVP
jgi:hypothetical protein